MFGKATISTKSETLLEILSIVAFILIDERSVKN